MLTVKQEPCLSYPFLIKSNGDDANEIMFPKKGIEDDKVGGLFLHILRKGTVSVKTESI
jgi:hypothetical protein